MLISAVRLLIVVPARIGSTRLPEKPLRPLGGEPLVRVVARRVLDWRLDARFVVATDDARVIDAVAPLGVHGVMTAGRHGSGTERVAEVASRPEFADADVVLNLQGDEPFMPRAAAEGALERIRRGDAIGTAAQPLASRGLIHPDRVKVEVDERGRARRFYRHPSPNACVRPHAVFQHLGVYAYTRDALARWVTLPPVPDEFTERLEQLRPFHHGMPIGVSVLSETVPAGIDTIDDLRFAEARL